MPRVAHVHGVLRGVICVPVLVASGTGAEDYLTDLVLGARYKIEKCSLALKTVGAGAGASRVLDVVKKVGSTSTTIATATLTLAGTATKGLIVDIPVTAANALLANDSDTLSVRMESGGTSFSALEGMLYIRYRESPQAIN